MMSPYKKLSLLIITFAFQILQSWPGDWPIAVEKFEERVLQERQLVNTIKHMALAQKIILQKMKMGKHEASALSKELYEYAFGLETPTATLTSPSSFQQHTVTLPLFGQR